MYAIFERAATAEPGAKGAVPLVNFVIDVPTLERLLNATGDRHTTGRSAPTALRNSRRHPGPTQPMWWRR